MEILRHRPHRRIASALFGAPKCHLPYASYIATLPAVRRKPVPKHRSGCPVSVSLEVFGDRWSLLIVRDLMIRGFHSFKEFQESGEGIATNILADRLRRLEATGIIAAEADTVDRRRVSYRLTEKGIDLAPVLLELLLWGARNAETALPCAQIEGMVKHRDEIVSEARRRWKNRDLTPLQVDGEWRLPW